MARQREALCWHVDDDGRICDATLAWRNGWWRCPRGHQLHDIPRWLRDHIELMQGDRGLIGRFFGGL